MTGETKSIVLVHGGFVDGSGWRGVYDILKRDGYNVTIVQNPTTSLAADVAATRSAIAALDGPIVLVGHSYGGVVITEAGTDPKVERLVYIAAFAPDAGELVQSLIANPPAGAPVPPILPPQDGFLFLDRAKFAASFAADVDAATAAFMADSQVPWGVDALAGAVSEPAWRTKPSWYLVATDDRMIPPTPSARWRPAPARPLPRPPAATRSTSRTRPRSPRSSSVPPRRPRRSTSRKRKHPGPVGPRLARQLLADFVEKVRRTRASKRMENRFFSIVGHLNIFLKYSIHRTEVLSQTDQRPMLDFFKEIGAGLTKGL